MAQPRRIREDVVVANNERARRRRARQRRAARLRAERTVDHTTSRFHRHGITSENKDEEIKEEAVDMHLTDLLSEPLTRYCEAVVHPFGNMAIGATLPDRYQELVIPVTDRLELDLTPDLFNLPGSDQDWAQDPNVQLSGVFIWFQPRCLSAGIASFYDGATNQFNSNPYVSIDDTFTTIDTSGMVNAYNLCFTGIWELTGSPVPVTYGFYTGNAIPTVPTYAAIQYTRFDNIASNCDKMRILGAGLKVWSEQAPINTGGFSVGGWITLEDIEEALVVGDQATALNPGALKVIQPKIKFACRTQGVKGSTVRYSPVQTAEQTEPEYPRIPERMYDVLSSMYDGAPLEESPFYIRPTGNSSLATNDMTTPGSYVPCVYWAFNVTDESTQANAVYTLKLMSMVHAEGTPTGESPFMSNKSDYDNAVEHIKMMLENPEMFPPATKGNSFKSFMKKTRSVLGKIRKGASKTVQILSLLDKVF